jgi:uncharacterized membrane protein YtjA (UPF0391 family)
LRWFCARNWLEPSFQRRIGSAVVAALFNRADTRTRNVEKGVHVMLSWVVTFLIIALIAGILGFGGIAGASIEIAKVIFFIAVVLFLVSAVVGLARGRTRL